LQENTTVSQLTPSKALDMQLAELMPLTTRIVAQAFGLSAHLLGENESTSYSSAAESARSFARFCLKPWQTRINDALSRSLLTREQRAAGYAVSSDLESLTRGDGDELATVSSKLANAGLLSPNEIRDWYGQADVEGGDLLRAPTNTQPITDWSKPKTSKAMRVQNIRIKRAMSHAVSHNR
jgi:HK97 family phage portal protein